MKQHINQKEKFTRWDFLLWAMLVGFLVMVVFVRHSLQLKSRDNDPNRVEVDACMPGIIEEITNE